MQLRGCSVKIKSSLWLSKKNIYILMRDCWWSSVWQLFVMHFWFDQYYYQSVKKKRKGKRIKGSGIGVKNLGIPSSGRRPQWGPLFAFLPLIHCLVCVVVLFLVFFSEERWVCWFRSCEPEPVRVCKEQTEAAPWWADFDPISNICPQSGGTHAFLCKFLYKICRTF